MSDGLDGMAGLPRPIVGIFTSALFITCSVLATI